MNAGDFRRHLRKAGCELDREGGNHSIYRQKASGAKSAVPRHGEIGPGMVRKICGELGIERPKGR